VRQERSFLNRFARASLLAGTTLAGASLGVQAAAQSQQQADQASADQGQAPAIEEIVVTAQKRQQSLQDVGVSVTALSEEELRRFNFRDSTQLTAQVPNFSFGTPVGKGNNPAFSMRGVGLVNPFEDNQEGKVGIYRDGVYQGTLAGQTLQMFDLERVEVLRGPQGTLYGRNSTGGLVNFIANKPGDELGGYLRGTGGEFSQIRLQGAVNLPLSERVKTRIAFDFNQDDGFVENRFRGGNFDTDGVTGNDTNSFAGRAFVDIDASENLDLLLNVHGSRVDQFAAYYQHQGVLTENGGLCSSKRIQNVGGTNKCFDFFGFRDNDGDVFAGEYDRRGPLQVQNLGGFAKLEATIGDLNLTSISAVETYEKFHQEDTDLSPRAIVEPTFTVDTEQITQEIRLSQQTERTHWILGGYLFYDERTTPRLELTLFNDEESQDLAVPGPGALPGALPFRGGWDQETLSGAGFARFEYDVTSNFTVVTGLRFTAEEKDFTYNIQQNLAGGAQPGEILNTDNSFEGITARVNLNYRPAENQLYYAAFSRGFQSGGFNGGFALNGPLGGFDEEILNSYELGAKTDWFDGRLRLNAAAFFYDYNDAQLLDFDPQSLANIALNANQVDIYGGELEMVANPFEGLTATLNLGLLDSEIKSAPGEFVLPGPVQEGAPTGTQVDIRGNELVLAPNVTANGVVRYETGLGEDSGRLGMQVEFDFTGEQFFSLTNDPILGEDAYTVWNFKLDWTTPDERLKFTFFADNAFNKEYKTWTFDFSADFGFVQNFFGEPRRLGGSITYNF